MMDRNGVYGAPRFHMAAKKAGIRAHIGSEITCTNGVRLSAAGGNARGLSEPVPAGDPHEAARQKGRRRGHAGGDRRIRPRADLHHAPSRRAAARDLRPRQCLRRAAAPLPPRRGGAQPGHRGARAPARHSAGGHQRRRLRHARRSANCWTCSPASATT